MPYENPGVDVTQEIRTNTPVYLTPELESCIVGQSYFWQNPMLDDSQIDVSQENNTFVLSEINSTHNLLDVDDDKLVTVTLIGVSGSDAGKQKHLVNAVDFTVVESGNVTTVTITNSGLTGLVTGATYKAKVGFRAKNTQNYGFNKLVSITELTEVLGEDVTFNPLAYAAKVAINNSSKAVWVYKTNYVQDEVDIVGNELLLKDVHKIAVARQVTNGEVLTIKTAVNYASLPEVKKERLAYVNKYVDYAKELSTLTSGEKVTIAETIRDANALIGAKRIFSIHPSWGYKLEKRHILTLSPEWIAQSFAKFCVEADIELLKLYAILPSKVGSYKAGTKIDATVWSALLSLVSDEIEVYVPVPGFYYTAAVLGLATGLAPDQPLTNSAISGVDKTIGAQDTFIQADLNTMASGGTWLMTQLNENSPISNRHQLSTNNLSIIEREHSITTVVDYTAKFTRDSLAPYIGKYNISSEYIKLVKDKLEGISTKLVEELKYLLAYEIISVTQDELNPDTLRIEIRVAVKYPANYIKITLVV